MSQDILEISEKTLEIPNFYVRDISPIEELMNEFESFLKEKVSKIIFSYASTLDMKFVLNPEHIENILNEFSNDINIPVKIRNSIHTSLMKFSPKKQNQRATDSEVMMENIKCIKYIENYIRDKISKNNIYDFFRRDDIGSGAAISFSASYKLHENNIQKNISSHFVGLLPRSVSRHIQDENAKSKRYSDDFDKNFKEFAIKTNENPITLSLESKCGTKKCMMSYIVGRRPEDLPIEIYISKLEQLINTDAKLFSLQIGSLNKGAPESHRTIIKSYYDSINANSKNGYIYAGLSDCKNDTKKIQELADIAYIADILSYNENETNQFYTGLATNSDTTMPIFEKFLRIMDNTNSHGIKVNDTQLKISHSASGAIAYINTNSPKEVIDFISGLLQIAIDGTSYVYQNGTFANYEEIKEYSNNTYDKNKKSFMTDFGFNSMSDLMHSGLSYAISPKITHPKGSLTGLGATVDGISTSLMTLGLEFLKQKNLI